jgi:hypothetical protein
MLAGIVYTDYTLSSILLLHVTVASLSIISSLATVAVLYTQHTGYVLADESYPDPVGCV